MPNQILDKKEIAKDANNTVKLENQYENLAKEIENVNEKNINISKENIEQESNNSYIFNNINTFQQRYIELLQDISKKTLEVNKNIIDINQSLYLDFSYNSGKRIYDDINKKIYNNSSNLVNIFNDNVLINIEKFTKIYEIFLVYLRQTNQNLSDKPNSSLKG